MKKNKQVISIHWFRRDLRLDDNASLYHALKCGNPVIPVFIFDSNILDKLEDKSDRRVIFIHRKLNELQDQFIKLGTSLVVKYGNPDDCWNELISEFKIISVFANHDYEPYAIEKDKQIEQKLIKNKIEFKTFKDQVIFEKGEVVKEDGKPYTIFTPYSKKWLSKLSDFYLETFQVDHYKSNFLKIEFQKIPSLKEIGFEGASFEFPELVIDDLVLKNYKERRDIPGIRGTSQLGIHLRFGTVSIRKLVKHAKEISEVWLNELIWREFFMMILWHFPDVVNNSFKKKYDRILWRNNEKEFELWCKGMTGYPLVDAGMRELNATGFMHNRVRMVVASFLCKHLLIDWRWGEAYFAKKLLDYELSSNNGNWQWAAGTGCDAAPYFRIFNPSEQAKKFDPDLNYIRKWVPEYDDFGYPQPIVDHKFARERCLSVYSKVVGQK